MKLADIVSVNQRYSRSVNLERDMFNASSMSGYILSRRNGQNLARILSRVATPDQPRSWTITGLYGTGKSAFANVMLGLFSPSTSATHSTALDILKDQCGYDEQMFRSFRRRVGRNGLIRAATTASRESLSNTVIRALHNGVVEFWKGVPGARPAAYGDILDAFNKISRGKRFSSQRVLELVRAVATASASGIIILIDELGKNLEQAASQGDGEDLYLLQQLAELPAGKDDPIIVVVGILHQAFSEYSQQMAITSQREWAKIQGRFEDIPFHEASIELTRLMSKAICRSVDNQLENVIRRTSLQWVKCLKTHDACANLTQEDIAALYPFHPVSAIALPILSERFAQNDRSVFTFLASEEPHSFGHFLRTADISDSQLPNLKLPNLYDYFIESLGVGIGNHRLFQRWTEIQDAVADGERLGPDHQNLLKIIGVLNLISSSGSMRASPETVLLALSDHPVDSRTKTWKKHLQELISKGIVVHRRQVNELRVWHGSDFDLESAVELARSNISESTAELFNKHFSQPPLVASRHSYQTGTLRHFERRFLDSSLLGKIDILPNQLSDGTVYYWCDESLYTSDGFEPPPDGKPVLIVQSSDSGPMSEAIREYSALQFVAERAPEIRVDGVARRELRHRLRIARELVDRTFRQAFHCNLSTVIHLSDKGIVQKYGGQSLSAVCSTVCDRVYNRGLSVRNELINRDSLTSQAAKARRELFEYMIEREGEPLLGITGYGPERSLFESVLASTEIYSVRNGQLRFGDPCPRSGVYHVWKAIEDYCKDSTEVSRPLSQLYEQLKRPPYGVKTEIVPIFLLAVLLKHSDDMSLYQDGSFLPILRPEHLELLVKRPERFCVKSFRLRGLRVKLFEKLESSVRKSTNSNVRGLRNSTLLGIVTPLVRFVNALPRYTLQTQSMDPVTRRVRECLLSAKEPDSLLFDELPAACGLESIKPVSRTDDSIVTDFRRELVRALKILNERYSSLLSKCHVRLCEAFSLDVDSPKLREHLRVRASYLLGSCIEPRLKGFINAAVEESSDDKTWLESLLMIIADKPVTSWTDDDELSFQDYVHDMARRFMNLEAIRKEFTRDSRKGFAARRVILTRPNGEEASGVFWVEKKTQQRIDEIVARIIEEHGLSKDSYLLQGVLATMLDGTLFDHAEEDFEEYNTLVEVKKSGKTG